MGAAEAAGASREMRTAPNMANKALGCPPRANVRAMTAWGAAVTLVHERITYGTILEARPDLLVQLKKVMFEAAREVINEVIASQRCPHCGASAEREPGEPSVVLHGLLKEWRDKPGNMRRTAWWEDWTARVDAALENARLGEPGEAGK